MLFIIFYLQTGFSTLSALFLPSPWRFRFYCPHLLIICSTYNPAEDHSSRISWAGLFPDPLERTCSCLSVLSKDAYALCCFFKRVWKEAGYFLSAILFHTLSSFILCTRLHSGIYAETAINRKNNTRHKSGCPFTYQEKHCSD